MTASNIASRPPSRPLALRRPVASRRHRHGERLHLDEQRPLSGHRRDDHRSGDTTAAVGKEQVRRVGHADEAAIGHLEQPEPRSSVRSDA